MKLTVTALLVLLLVGVGVLGYTGKLEIPPQGTNQMITLQVLILSCFKVEFSNKVIFD